ncbi:MAG: TonB family protein [Sulfuriferula sp.]|nr:TonB family protein [Sulfuriferula sp.]
MSHPVELREPELSPAARRVLAALLFSIGLHAAIIGLVRLTPVRPSVPSVLQVQLPLPQAAKPAPVQPVATGVAVKAVSTISPQPIQSRPLPAVAPAPVPPLPAVHPVTAVPEPRPVAQTHPGALTTPTKADLPTVNVPLLVDNTYYTAKEVDVHPRALRAIVPVYPQAAADKNIEGWVLLEIRLDDTGKVEDVKVGDASPPGVFDQAAVDAFLKAGFIPAQKAGRPVKSLVEIKVWFNLD